MYLQNIPNTFRAFSGLSGLLQFEAQDIAPARHEWADPDRLHTWARQGQRATDQRPCEHRPLFYGSRDKGQEPGREKAHTSHPRHWASSDWEKVLPALQYSRWELDTLCLALTSAGHTVGSASGQQKRRRPGLLPPIRHTAGAGHELSLPPAYHPPAGTPVWGRESCKGQRGESLEHFLFLIWTKWLLEGNM